MIKYGTITTIIDEFDVSCCMSKENVGKIAIIEVIYEENDNGYFGESRLFTDMKKAEEFKESILKKNKEL